MKSYNYNSSRLMITSLIYPCLILIGCSSVAETKNIKIAEPKIMICKEPRPQLCTLNYQPVCATTKNTKEKTYANGCSACSDKNVINYREGACE